jgi:hypothetical protein
MARRVRLRNGALTIPALRLPAGNYNLMNKRFLGAFV